MPNDELISQYVDRPAIQAETDFLLAQIKQVIDAIEKIGNAKISFSGAQGMTQMKASVQEVQAAADGLVNTTKTLTVAMDAERQVMQKTGTVVNELDKSTASAANSATALGDAHYSAAQKMKQSTLESDKLAKAKQALAYAQGEENVQLQGYKLQSAEATKAAKAEAMAGLGLVDAYKQLTVEYEIAQRNAKNLAVQFGINSVEAKSAAAQALALNTQLQTIDKTVGQSQKNVGNYGNVFTKAYSGIRQLAYILPGIGIAGIFNLAFEAVAKFTEKISGADDASEKLAQTTKKEAEEIKKLEDSFRNLEAVKAAGFGAASGDVAKVQGLTSVVLDQTESYDKRNRALKELAAINKNYFGDLTLETASLQKLKAASDEYTQAIINQAIIKELQSDIGKVGAEYFKQQKIVTDLEKAQRKLTDAVQDENKAWTDANTKAGQRSFIVDRSKESVALVSNIQKQKEALRPLADQYNGLFNQIKDFERASVSFKPLTTDKGSKEGKEIKPIQEKYDDSYLKQEAADEKKLSEIVSLELASRLRERHLAADDELEIIHQTAKAEIDNETAKLNAVKNKKGVSPTELINATNEYITKTSAINQKAAKDQEKIELDLQRDIIGIKQSAIGQKLALDKEYNDLTIGLMDASNAKQEQKLLDKQAAQIKIATDTKNKELDAAGEIYKFQIEAANGNQEKIKAATDRFNKAKLAIEFEYAAKVLQIEIDTAKKQIALRKSLGEDTIAAEDALNKAQFALDDLRVKHTKDANDQEVKSWKDKQAALVDILGKIKDIGDRLFDDIGKFMNISTVKQKNALQAQSDALDRNTQKEIDAANATTNNAQEKAAKIAIIEARAQTQKDAIARKQRQLDQEQARIDKAKAIFDITLNTAIAVVKALPNIPLAIAIGSLGAAELAIAISTQIPKYKYGTQGKPHRGGPAIMGDGGVSEYVRLPNGQSFVTSNKAELYDLPQGAEVFPDIKKLSQDLFSAKQLRPMPAIQVHSDIGELSKKLDKLTQVVKDKKELHLTGSHAGALALWKDAANTFKYIEQQTSSFL